MSALTRAALLADLEARSFAAPISAALTPRRVGAEAEFIPVESSTGRRCPIEGEGAVSSLPFLRRYAARTGWMETRTCKGTPSFLLPGGGTLTFEPGGQIEYSSPPCRSPSALLSQLRGVVPALQSAAAAEGITLLHVGLDPLNTIDGAPLLLHHRRYARMAEYLALRGPSGARMMRQTASFQVNLDFDDEPRLRWQVLNAAAPYLTAIFANSALYAGADTGWVSARAQAWRALDPLRTGMPFEARRPVAAYLDFALGAPALLLPTLGGEHLRFRDWLVRAEILPEEWHDHLTTLFPEIRPRGHLEVRSIDAVAPSWYAAPLALTVGITYDPATLRSAAELLGTPDLALLDRAGRLGVRDPAIARTAADLAELALEGCRSLGPAYFHPEDVEEARGFVDQYTRRGRCPADDREVALAAA